MDAAQATMNALYAVNSDNLIVSLLLASLVPFIAKQLYYFFQEVWPRMLHNFFIRNVLYREVAVVEQYGEGNESGMDKMVDSAVLIEMILEYVGHLARQAQQHQQQQQQLPHEKRSTESSSRAGAAPWMPAMNTMANLPYAAYRYAPIPTQGASVTSAFSAKRAPVKDPYESGGGVQSDGSAEVATFARYLKENFQLTLAPTNEVAMEVEPNLFVRYLPATQTLQELKEQREKNVKNATGSNDSGQAALAAHGMLEDYLLYDLINRLQENGKKKETETSWWPCGRRRERARQQRLSPALSLSARLWQRG